VIKREAWQIKGGEDDRGSPTLDIWAGYKIVASICLDWSSGRDDPAADARLIVAAPELLETLTRVEVLLTAIVDKAGEYRLPGTDARLAHYATYHQEAIRAAIAVAMKEE